MAAKHEIKYIDLAIHQKVLANAYSELQTGKEATTGRLCDDIASLGYAQELAIEDIFKIERAALEERLASRVCENCILWQRCERFVPGDIPVDIGNRFGIGWNPDTPSEEGIVDPVTPHRRQVVRDFARLAPAGLQNTLIQF